VVSIGSTRIARRAARSAPEAQSATRMPISLVRLKTEYEITPKTPVAPAIAANRPRKERLELWLRERGCHEFRIV